MHTQPPYQKSVPLFSQIDGEKQTAKTHTNERSPEERSGVCWFSRAKRFRNDISILRSNRKPHTATKEVFAVKKTTRTTTSETLFSERRKDFPSLSRTHNGLPLAYLDGPGGTQIPRYVIEAMVHYYSNCNANSHGFFVTTQESDCVIEEARKAMATFLGAEGPHTISFGANMTTLNFSLSHALESTLQPGDEVLITQLDHEANRGPWLRLRSKGVLVREIALRKDGTLDYDDFRSKTNERTRLTALGFSSNALGTVNDIALARELTYRAGSLLLVDAVHGAPHFPLDVRALGLDFLLCSAYKFYGPHVGILYAREGLLERLNPDRLRTQDQRAPFRIETGTLNHAAIAGVKAAVEYIASFGDGADLREKITSAMNRIGEAEHVLAKELYEGLRNIPGVTVHGPSFTVPDRAPTVSFTLEGHRPPEICSFLNERAICAWDGDFYAIRPVEILGLLEQGGLVRLGLSLYNTRDEVQRALDAVRELAETAKKRKK